jgi:hypothetical protein
VNCRSDDIARQAGAWTPPPDNSRAKLGPRRQAQRPAHDFALPLYEVPLLPTATHIGVMGDLHGDLEHAIEAFQTFATRDVRCIIQLGDLGVLWPGGNWQTDLRKLSRALARHAMSMFWVEGNHDYYPQLFDYAVAGDGLRWITANVAHLPRGFRTLLGERFTLAALGGANSIDFRFREAEVSWWPEEQISDADLRLLGSERADVLIGHEAPLIADPDASTNALDAGYSVDDIRYAAASRMMFRRAVSQTRPRLTLGGHYHRFYDESWTLPGETRPTRTVVLDMNGKHRVNLAILSTTTLDLEFLYRNGTPYVPDTNTPDRSDHDRRQP